jgi:hypothetical protein
MKLIFIHGAPGVGKLTVARELHTLTAYPVFHNHLVVDMLSQVFGLGTPAFVALREEVWLAVFGRASQERLPGVIFTFVFEPTVLPGFFPRVQSALSPDDTIIPVELRCELEENARRIVLPERSAYGKLTSAETLRGWVGAGDYEPPEPVPGNFVIDNTHLSAMETAQRILERLAEVESL